LAGRPTPVDGYGSPPRSAWLDVDWPTHRRWIALDGARLNVVELGSGPPVVLVHGHDGSWRNWLENIPDLAASHRVVALDLPGFGDSPLPPWQITIPSYARLVGQLCTELSLERPAFVGHSMGGLICAELAITDPDRVNRLVLVAAAGLSRRYGPIPRQILARPQLLPSVLQRVSRAVGRRARFLAGRRRLRKAGLGLSVRHPDLLSATLAAQVIRSSGAPGGPVASAAVARHEIANRLGGIVRPTLVIWGADDAVVAVDAADRYAELIPGAQMLILADTGHLPMLERPARFNELLEGFLAPARPSS
jgi:pimeloyl-ACP methyl ester carboxylesterase